MFVSVCVLSCVCILSLMAPSVALSGNSTKPSAGKIQIKPYSNSRKKKKKKKSHLTACGRSVNSGAETFQRSKQVEKRLNRQK